jgi:hypothetical protein
MNYLNANAEGVAPMQKNNQFNLNSENGIEDTNTIGSSARRGIVRNYRYYNIFWEIWN